MDATQREEGSCVSAQFCEVAGLLGIWHLYFLALPTISANWHDPRSDYNDTYNKGRKSEIHQDSTNYQEVSLSLSSSISFSLLEDSDGPRMYLLAQKYNDDEHQLTQLLSSSESSLLL